MVFIDVNSAVLTPNEAKISWQTNKTARGFVRYGLTEDLLNTTDSTIVPGFLSAITLENLTADTTYYFLVSAMDTTGDGIESEMMSFVTTLIPVLAENIAAQALLTASSENENGNKRWIKQSMVLWMDTPGTTQRMGCNHRSGGYMV
ncbi:MAG: fibronectin type III domain-containing protein [Deferribacteres bacterium]|nr:fibronectin type III domain-containing protein [Deferribacteres bacterium]